MPVGVSRTAKKKRSVSELRRAPSVAVRNLYICTIGGVCVCVCERVSVKVEAGVEAVKTVIKVYFFCCQRSADLK